MKDLGTLPIELLVSIVTHLDLTDFMRIRAVSRRWNAVFSSFEICSAFTKLYFLPQWNTLLSGQYDKRILADWLPQAAFKRLQRLNGRYCSVSSEKYNTKPGASTRRFPPPRQVYCNGKIAYNYDDRTVVVRDLRTQEEILLREENRELLSNWILSERHLIARKETL